MPCHQRVHLGLGRTYQIANLFFNLSVLDNVILALNRYKGSPFHMFQPLAADRDLFAEVESLLTRVGILWEKREVPLSRLSYGEIRQMELILGLGLAPKLLLLDEPTAGLTSSEAAVLSILIRKLPDDITVLMIEHDMKVAFDLADSMIVLHQGEILASGSPAEIKANAQVKGVYFGGTQYHGRHPSAR